MASLGLVDCSSWTAWPRAMAGSETSAGIHVPLDPVEEVAASQQRGENGGSTGDSVKD